MYPGAYTLFVSCLLLLTSGFLRAQVTGFILDASTGEALAGAHIWFDQTTCGTTSRPDGSFQLACPLEGKHELIVSYLGYHTWNKIIILPSAEELHIKLDVNTEILEEVTVVEKASRRRKFTRQFLQSFLGYTSNARKCRVLNPEVLEFNPVKDGLHVTAPVPLTIENNALGYQILFLLEEAIVRGPDIQYLGKAFFRSLDGEGASTQQLKNRRKAYLGSSRHFFQSLVKGETAPAGYQVWHALPSNEGMQRIAKARPGRLIQPHEGHQGEYALSFNGYLEIVYLHEKGRASHRDAGSRNLNKLGRPAEREMILQERNRFKSPDRNQVSWIRLPGQKLVIDSRGIILNEQLLEQQGSWANERVADMLPFNFQMNPD